MSTAIADQKKRLVLPNAKPGDVFDIQQRSENEYILTRLIKPEPRKKMTVEEVRKAIEKSPLTPVMSWEELKKETREF